MKNKFSVFAVISICSIATLTGCYKPLEITNVKDFSEISIGLEGFKSNLEVEIYNPNFYPIELSETKISLRVRDTDAGDVRLLEMVNLSARNTTTISFHVVSRKGAIAEILKNDVFNFLKGEKVPFSASGTVSGKSWGIQVEVPLEHSQKISLRK